MWGGVEPFVQVAEVGSFRGAARRLGVSPSAVSKAVARLEDELGVTLLVRTTRSVALTAEGAEFLAHARAALDALQAGRDVVEAAREAPRGRVRLSIPKVLGARITAALPRLLARHPRLEVDLRVTDRNVRLVDEGIDVAVRIGALEDSALLGRRLRTSRLVTAASPAYLARHGAPEQPAELARHSALRFLRTTGSVTPWRFREGEQLVTPDVGEQVRMNDGDLLVQAAVAGLGLIQAFDFMVEAEISAGRLVEVLSSCAAPGPPVQALYLPGTQRVPRIRVVLDTLVSVFERSAVAP